MVMTFDRMVMWFPQPCDRHNPYKVAAVLLSRVC